MPIGSREIIKRLKSAGWYRVGQTGSHVHFKHPDRTGKVTVVHPAKDTSPGVRRDIERKTGLRLR